MTAPHHTPIYYAIHASLAGLLAGLMISLTANGAETVILKDGFVLQGNVRKEVTSINDPATGKTFPIAKATGLDMIDEGPKIVIFSTHARQLGEVGKDVKLRPDYKAYTRFNSSRRSNHPLPSVMAPRDRDAAEFNDAWRRTIHVNLPGNNFDRIEQQISYIDPYFVYLWSSTHIWRLGYRTSEMDPAKVETLLSTHPELIEEKDKPDALKRIAKAKFKLDTGWIDIALQDLNSIRKAFPEGIPTEAREAFDKLTKEIDVAIAGRVVREAEFALESGRYSFAQDVLAVFPEKTADAKQTEEVTKLMAKLKATQEQYETGKRLLNVVIDGVTGLDHANPMLAIAGGPSLAVVPRKTLAPPLSSLVAAAEEVNNELHPDSANRIEFFVNLAAQVERETRQGRDPSKRPEELLATAISGWVKGKNGATTDVKLALGLWAARETVLSFQRSNDVDTRNQILTAYKTKSTLKIDELAQVISMLPPSEPEDLLFRTGDSVPLREGLPSGVYRRKIPAGRDGGDISYLVKLPPEYHHGRAYPVLIALTDPNVDARFLLASLATEADRHGYIILAPEWANQFGRQKEWDYNGDDHVYVTAVLRDAIRHFCVDNDRVFLFGAANGANMAMDVGVSHPDLFAGVLAMGPIPRWVGFFSEYWKNAQKLPFYVVTGEIAGNSVLNLRSIFEKWMPYGFPGLMVVYKGRGVEWYSAEVPVMFDWMGRKKRVAGTATLQLNTGARFKWTTMRKTDNHFYWIGVDEIHERNLMENARGTVVPAEIQGDIAGNNVIHITSRGITKISVWLSQEMIDWSKPVGVNINRTIARGWKARVLEPRLDVLLNDYRQRGDRRMLFLEQLTFDAIP